MARTGKIARLPKWIRDEVNRCLRQGVKAGPIVQWLNSHPDVRAVLDAEFAGRPIREQNMSDWRKGGYREWLAQRLALEHGMEMCARVGNVARGSKVPRTENLAAFSSAQYALALGKRAHGSKQAAAENQGEPRPPSPEQNENGDPGKSG